MCFFTFGDRVRLIIFNSCLKFLHHETCKNTTQIPLLLECKVLIQVLPSNCGSENTQENHQEIESLKIKFKI